MTASSHDGKITLGGVQYDAPSSLYYVQSDLLTIGLGYRF